MALELPNMALVTNIQDYYLSNRIQFTRAEREVAMRGISYTPQRVFMQMLSNDAFNGMEFNQDDLARLKSEDPELHAVRGAKLGDMFAAAVFYPEGDTPPHFHPVITFQGYAVPLLKRGITQKEVPPIAESKPIEKPRPLFHADATVKEDDNGWTWSIPETQPDAEADIVPLTHGLVQINNRYFSHGLWAKRAGIFFPLIPESLEGKNTEKVSARSMRNYEAVPRPGG